MLSRVTRKGLCLGKKFDINAIMSGQKVPKLNLFVGGRWVESEGDHTSVPYPFDQDITIFDVPNLSSAAEREMIKRDMQTVNFA